MTIAISERRLKKLLIFLVSFAVGGLFGDAFIHILPEAFEKSPSAHMVSFGILGGIFLFFIRNSILFLINLFPD